MEHYGELAAFGTAVCWTISAIFFENASRRVGALAVNFYKVVAAFIFLGIASLVLRGLPFPVDAPARTWLFLSLSGIIGFVVADYFLFNAYVLIGSRITVIFQALTPLFTAILGFFVLGERMRTRSLLGMGLVVLGIVVVVVSRNRGTTGPEAAKSTGSKEGIEGKKGYVFAFFSSVFQAVGLIFSKLGLADYDAVSSTQIRVMTAVLGFGIQAILLRKGRSVFIEARRDVPAMRATAIGAIFGPFLGVTFSLFALQHTSAGTASTLMALTPVLIIPPSVILLKQRVRGLEILGAGIAVAGAALFFLL